MDAPKDLGGLEAPKCWDDEGFPDLDKLEVLEVPPQEESDKTQAKLARFGAELSDWVIKSAALEPVPPPTVVRISQKTQLELHNSFLEQHDAELPPDHVLQEVKKSVMALESEGLPMKSDLLMELLDKIAPDGLPEGTRPDTTADAPNLAKMMADALDAVRKQYSGEPTGD